MAVAKRKPPNAQLEGDDILVSEQPTRQQPTAAELIDSLRAVHLTPPELLDLMELADARLTDDFHRHVAARKNSRDGQGIPVGVIEQELLKLGGRLAFARWSAAEWRNQNA